MNIFILSDQLDPTSHYLEQAAFHVDKHVVKMIAESTQMLVTALHTSKNIRFSGGYVSDAVANMPCKPLAAGMTKHPCTAWTCADIKHVNYVCQLAIALCNEHQYRYPLSPEHAYAPWLRALADLLATDHGLSAASSLPTAFAVAVKNVDLRSTHTPHWTACDIYRDYYVRDKVLFASWKRRAKPLWFIRLQEAMQQA